MSNIAWAYGSSAGLSSAGFPQIAECADGAVVRRRLAADLGVDPGPCEVLNIWSVAGRSLRAAYRAGGATLAVEFLRVGQSAARYRAALGAAVEPAAVLHLPGWGAVAWRFPEDPGGLRVADLLARGQDLSAEPGEARLLSYLPGERCTVRIGGVVGKIQRGAGLAESHARLRALWAMAGRRMGMPEPLAADPGLGARWERFALGRRLGDLPAGAIAGAMAELARGLAWLHATPLPDLTPQGPEQILRRIERKVLPRVRAALPDLAAEAAGLHAALAAAPPPARSATIHGDLHSANVLIGAGGPVFIDLDSLAAGDPAYDLALLGGRLTLAAMLRGESPPPWLAALPAIYAGAGGAPIPAPTFAWYMAALLLGRQLKACLRSLAPRSDRLTPALLGLAREVFLGPAAACVS